MRATVMTSHGGPEVLQAQDIPRPSAGPGQLLVRVHATSVNPIDLKLRAGVARVTLQPPAVLGYDVAGVVETVGPGVAGFQPGDAVFYTADIDPRGAYADYHVTRADIVAPLPAGLSFEQAAAIPLAGATAWGALMDRAQLHAGEMVLIHAGAGGVGSMAVQIAKATGARVVATCRAENRDFVAGLGADRVIDYRGEDVAAATLQATGGRGVDVVFDTVGGDTLARSIEATRPFGRLVSIVTTTGDLHPGYLKNLTIHLMFLQRRRETMEALRMMVERGSLRPLVHEVLPLEEVAEAHRLLSQGGVRGKIVLKVA